MSHTDSGTVVAPTTFASLVKDARNVAKQSQSTVAERAGICREHLNRIENGKRKPSLSVALRLVLALGIDPEYLGDIVVKT